MRVANKRPDGQSEDERSTSGPAIQGDRILVAPGLTGQPNAMWASVDLVAWVLGEEILRGESGLHPWKIGYRVTLTEDIGPSMEQRGVTWLDDHGNDAYGSVLAIDHITSAPSNRA